MMSAIAVFWILFIYDIFRTRKIDKKLETMKITPLTERLQDNGTLSSNEELKIHYGKLWIIKKES